MRGLKFEDLVAIVDFLYYGEANIYQENLDTFLNIAEELDLKGLNGGEGGSEEGEKQQGDSSNNGDKPVLKAALRKNIKQPQHQNQQIHYESFHEDRESSKMTIALPKDEFSGDLKDLDEKLNTMIGRGENMVRHSENYMVKAYVCQVCGKEGQLTSIRNHIEANHLEGILIPCNTCDQTVSTRNALRKHKSKHHINII